MNDDYFMNIALGEAKKSLRSEDVPVGAVLVLDGKIILSYLTPKRKREMKKTVLDLRKGGYQTLFNMSP